MRYSIIGAGAIGSALAAQFARSGIEVAVATSKDPAAVAEALLADMVILAVPFEAVRGLVEQVPDWQQRIIVDPTNAIDYTDFSAADLGGRASSDLVAEWANNARVVKAFGNTWAKVLARDPRTATGRRVAFLSGNDAAANAEVGALAARFGFEPIDLGRNDAGGLLHSFGGPLTGRSFVSQTLVGNSPPEMDLAPE